MCFMHPQRNLLSLILHVYITLCGAIVCVSTTNSHTCMVVLITLSKVCAKGYATGCICMYSSQAVWCVAGQKNVQKSTCAAFISHIDVVNVMVDCRFTPSWALFPLICSFFCAFSRLWGLGGQTIGMSWLWGAVLSYSCSGSASVDYSG